jgi:pyrrolidone-carboxylate peptidase
MHQRFMLQPIVLMLCSVFTGVFTGACAAASNQPTTASVEELRIDAARKAMPQSLVPYEALQARTVTDWTTATTVNQLRLGVLRAGDRLWQLAKRQVAGLGSYDDRGLYWTRLQLTQFLRQHDFAVSLAQQDRLNLIEDLEHSSRGRLDLAYHKTTDKRVFITGFDPFLLDMNLQQSNPSGVLALLLDGGVISHEGVTAEINTAMMPVRYADFDAGEVESLLAPMYALQSVDMVITISMGRSAFDLEHFPGRRRSASAPDNLNVLAGGSQAKPLIPNLGSGRLEGPEFVEISLPYAAMQQALGDYPINDRRVVTTLEKTFDAESLEQLRWATAVRGGGGGYLSNEISYRSISLRNKLGSTVPTGHIHTPRMPEYDKVMLGKIATQVTQMLRLALTEL